MVLTDEKRDRVKGAQGMTQTMTDITMMEDSDSWPLWPYLPLISKSEERKCGFLFAGQGSKVFLGNVYDDRPKLPRTKYSSFEVVAEYWRID